jgi:hypothetical protein
MAAWPRTACAKNMRSYLKNNYTRHWAHTCNPSYVEGCDQKDPGSLGKNI